MSTLPIISEAQLAFSRGPFLAVLVDSQGNACGFAKPDALACGWRAEIEVMEQPKGPVQVELACPIGRVPIPDLRYISEPYKGDFFVVEVTQ